MADVKVKFLGDKTQISRTIGAIKKESQGIGGGFTRAGSALKSMALPALAIGTAIFKLGQQAGETADQLFDMRDQTGVATDKLQEMRFIADQAGVAQDFYANSVKEVIKAQDELQKGTGPASEAMERLAVSVKNTDGSMRSAEAITDDVIARLGAIEDPTLRAALAQDIFKRKFEDILPVLGLGADAMAEMTDAAHELGAVQSEEALTAANEYRQGMEKLQVAVQELVNQLMQELLPFLTNDLIPGLEWVIDVVGRASDGFNAWSRRMVGIQGDFFSYKRSIGELNTEIEKTGPVTRIAGEGMRAYADSIKTAADEVRKATDPAFALRKANETQAEALKRVSDLEDAGQTSTREYTDAVSDLLESQADLNFATEQYEDAGATAVDALFALGEQAGISKEAVDGLVFSLGNLNNAPISAGALGGDPGGTDPFGEDLPFNDPVFGVVPQDTARSITVNVSGGINTSDPAEARRFMDDVMEEIDRRNAEGV